MKKAVILLSGGLDSATVLAVASKKYACHALSFNYGQRHVIELERSKQLAAKYKIPHKIIALNPSDFSGSALTDKNIAVQKSGIVEGIPLTYVPARNTIFLSYALGYAEVLEADDIFIGVNALDYSGYPDCRPEFIEAFEKMANLASKRAVEGQKLTIHTPLLKLTKAQIIKLGVDNGADYSLTSSCYDPAGDKACGACDSCRLRLKGFSENNLKDPVQYA